MMVKRFVFLLPVALAANVCLSGCGGDAYSASMRYHVRNDPLVKQDIIGERPNPDPPGQLPLYSPKDVLDPRNPLFDNGKGMELFLSDNPKLLDPTRISEKERKELGGALELMFGTPRTPKVRLYPDSQYADLNEQLETTLKLGQQTLAEGSRLYRTHCLHCHGLTGDGHGPTAKWVNPHPRDYRQGMFKFQSVDRIGDADRKPRRADLYRTLEHGVEGTSMPAFNLLRSDELEALVSYVIHLSMRGQMEFLTIKNAFVYEPKGNKLVPAPDYADPVNSFLIGGDNMAEQIAKSWLDSQAAGITVGAFPFDENDQKKMGESVRRGQAIFLADDKKLKEYFGDKASEVKAASCVACHKDYGRLVNFKFDPWATMVRPANLTTGVYRGGRRPVDLYYRVHSGINGSGMLLLGNKLSPDQIWDVVNFVRVLPYPKMREAYKVEIQ